MAESSAVTFTFNGEPKYNLIAIQTRYSSWTSRVVPVLEYFKLSYKCTTVKLSEAKKYSKTGLIPVLIPLSPELNIEINDSLAICEFLAESHPELPLWPKDRVLRALARSAAAEMHSGFGELRNCFPANSVLKFTGKIPVTEKAKREVDRLLILWHDARTTTAQRLKELGEKDEGFLFGQFGIVDSFFWPILWRFRTYNLPLTTASPEALAWMKTMWSDPMLKLLVKDYFKQSEDPDTAIPHYDDMFKENPDIKCGRFEEDWEFTPA